MDAQKLIKKYEKENKSILNRRPDLTMQGDFTPDGIKLFCNNAFIDDLRALAKPSSVPQANELQRVSSALPPALVLYRAANTMTFEDFAKWYNGKSGNDH